MPTPTDVFTAIAAVATAVGVILVWQQLRVAAKTATTTFEDALAREYRDLIRGIPAAALLGQQLTSEQQNDTLDDFYRYIDLSNEQVFLWTHGRVTTATWESWAEGIRGNLQKPAFRLAWEQIAQSAPESFSELRSILPSELRGSYKAQSGDI